jgi:2-amino-4-hydroxy-6-hydroxymethyldihydropteridine diphosphokinase
LSNQESKQNIVFLGLGTNLGNKEGNLNEAIRHIATFATIIKQSPMHVTEPFGITAQPAFLNQVIQIETILAPEQLLEQLQKIEAKMGRIKTIRNGPRIIDVDILFYNNEIIKTITLGIPHPEITSRESVLLPMSEIAPEFIHPTENKTIAELYTTIHTHT